MQGRTVGEADPSATGGERWRRRSGATPTTLGLSDRTASRMVLELPDEIEAHVLIPVGYPLGRFGPVSRPAARSVTRFDRWS